MSVMLVEKPVFLKVDERRLLRELPAFFQSFRECLTELLQNAYRAGATEVNIVLNKDNRTLLFEDNGSGSDDPQAFLTAGRTGWDESVVTDPAGLGFFSLLGLSDEVVVTSRAVDHCAWRICVTQAAFLGEEVQWDPIHEQFAPQPSGTRIEARLGSKADLEVLGPAHQANYQEFRFLFPVDVKMTIIQGGKPSQPGCLGRTNLDGRPSLDTPVGRLIALNDKEREGRYGYHKIHTVWEHRVLKDDLWSRVESELNKLPDGNYVVKALRHVPMFWIVDPICGVRPKLPDRRELIHDESFHAAARTMAAALYEAFNIAGVRVAVEKLEIEDDLSAGSSGYHSWIFQALRTMGMSSIFRPEGDEILKLCGWEECPYKDYSEGHTDGYKEEGYSVNIPDRHYLVRNPLHVGDDDLACALNASGCWASDVHSDKEIQIQVFGAKIGGIDGFNFGTCDRIAVVVDGEVYRELDDLAFCYEASRRGDIVDKGDDDAKIEGGCLLVKTDDPTELRSRIVGLRRGSWNDEHEMRYFVYKSLYDNGDLDTYIPDEDEGSVDDEQLENDIVAAWMEVFQPEAAGAQGRYNLLVEINRQVARETTGLYSVIRMLHGFVEKYPEVAEAATMLQQLEAVDGFSLNEYKWEPNHSLYSGIPVKEEVGVAS
jgi:hypothetical protein